MDRPLDEWPAPDIDEMWGAMVYQLKPLGGRPHNTRITQERSKWTEVQTRHNKLARGLYMDLFGRAQRNLDRLGKKPTLREEPHIYNRKLPLCHQEMECLVFMDTALKEHLNAIAPLTRVSPLLEVKQATQIARALLARVTLVITLRSLMSSNRICIKIPFWATTGDTFERDFKVYEMELLELSAQDNGTPAPLPRVPFWDWLRYTGHMEWMEMWDMKEWDEKILSKLCAKREKKDPE